tara:strand:+ start:383 stop:571 length:189 start_codon:yes stop_codon:yes gene_type:complete
MTKKPTRIDKDYNLTNAENLKKHGYDPAVYIILKDGEVVIDSYCGPHNDGSYDRFFEGGPND